MALEVRRTTFATLVLIALGFQAPTTYAQCTNSPTTLTAPAFCRSYPIIGGPPYTRWQCFKNLNLTMEWNCAFGTGTMTSTAMSGGNVGSCYYIPGQNRLVVHQPLTGMSPGYCQILCDCGVLRIDETDGLPIELMSFGIDDEETGDDPEIESEDDASGG